MKIMTIESINTGPLPYPYICKNIEFFNNVRTTNTMSWSFILHIDKKALTDDQLLFTWFNSGANKSLLRIVIKLAKGQFVHVFGYVSGIYNTGNFFAQTKEFNVTFKEIRRPMLYLGEYTGQTAIQPPDINNYTPTYNKTYNYTYGKTTTTPPAIGTSDPLIASWFSFILGNGVRVSIKDPAFGDPPNDQKWFGIDDTDVPYLVTIDGINFYEHENNKAFDAIIYGGNINSKWISYSAAHPLNRIFIESEYMPQLKYFGGTTE